MSFNECFKCAALTDYYKRQITLSDALGKETPSPLQTLNVILRTRKLLWSVKYWNAALTFAEDGSSYRRQSAVEGDGRSVTVSSLITNHRDVNRALTRFRAPARVNCETLWLSSHLCRINLWLRRVRRQRLWRYRILPADPFDGIGHAVKSQYVRATVLSRIIIIKACGSNNERRCASLAMVISESPGYSQYIAGKHFCILKCGGTSSCPLYLLLPSIISPCSTALTFLPLDLSSQLIHAT